MGDKYICVDFDGTLVDHRFPNIGPDVPGAFEWLKRFHENGVKIILFTMRSDGQSCGDVLSDAISHIKSRGVDLFGINTNPTQKEWTESPKAYGHIYIDDAAIGCPLFRYPGFHSDCVYWPIVGPATMLRLKIGSSEDRMELESELFEIEQKLDIPHKLRHYKTK